MRRLRRSESQVAFENNSMYQCEEDEDESFGPCVSICDESGEWYVYTLDFFKTYFVPVEA